ncbi:MAG: hypothetical protein M1812_005258 [Candelaria pacifica]|nr:MAG: hypothetical protein M1812_005258 [Candelaria pacifica]
MTRPATPPILTELRNPSSSSSQVEALKALKHEIIGHEQKKEMWISLGAVTPIVRILATPRSHGKRPIRLSSSLSNQSNSLTPEDQVRLHATIIVGSIAQGGSAYVTPLLDASVLPSLLSGLRLGEYPPRVVLATLQSLNSIADALVWESDRTSYGTNVWNTLYEKGHVRSLINILLQSTSSTIVQQQYLLAADLISKTCSDEQHQVLLASCGALEALATRLASFVVAEGFVVPAGPRNTENIPLPASKVAKLPPILRAIGTIIANSKARTSQFVFTPAITSIFPKTSLGVSDSSQKATWSNHTTPPPASRNLLHNPMDYFLPQIPAPHHKGSSSQPSAFPPLGGSNPSVRQNSTPNVLHKKRDQTITEILASNEEMESPLLAWLIYKIRADVGASRRTAAWLLTLLYKAGHYSRQRDTTIGLLIVPILVQILDEDFLNSREPLKVSGSAFSREPRASSILAELVMDSPELQKAAVDAHAIKKLSQLLKKSFDPVPAQPASALWAPKASSDNLSGNTKVNFLGLRGPSQWAINILQSRRGALKALAAIAPFKDEYRKAIIGAGVVSFIIESLKPFPDDLKSVTAEVANGHAKAPNLAKGSILPEGNPPSIVLAACAAARALSRSVSILRTSLIDAGVAKPLFALLSSSDTKIKVAATAVVCNLVLEFSPMREAIIDSGVIKVLCEHAKSANVQLKLNAIWALKHLVYAAPNAVKKTCLDALGQGWLIQLMCDDTEDMALASLSSRADEDARSTTPIRMGTPNAAGEQVDILNAVEETGSFLKDEDDMDDGLKMADSIGALSRPHGDQYISQDGQNSPRPENGRSNVSDSNRARLAAIQELESNPVRQARRDDMAVQEQGLDFMRNLICGKDAPEMIDFLFDKLGQDRVFEILASKLRSRVINAFNRDKRHSSSSSYGNEPRIIHPQPEIIISVCYVLVHIAGGSVKHRQLLMSQTELLKLLVPLFNHSNRTIRVSCVWVIINLTWMDNESDGLNCRARADGLRQLGIDQKLKSLAHDADLDVRERTKTALHQMNESLSGAEVAR